MDLIKENNLKVGDILFTGAKKGLVSNFISWILLKFFDRVTYTYIKISHTALYAGNGFLVEMSWFGLRIHTLNKYPLNKYNISRGRVKGTINASDIYKYVKDKEGMKYGFLTLFTITFKKIFNLIGLKKYTDLEDDRMICSEFIVDLYRDLFDIDLGDGLYSCDVTPLDIFNSKNVEIEVL